MYLVGFMFVTFSMNLTISHSHIVVRSYSSHIEELDFRLRCQMPVPQLSGSIEVVNMLSCAINEQTPT